jgi:hypothetical protein
MGDCCRKFNQAAEHNEIFIGKPESDDMKEKMSDCCTGNNPASSYRECQVLYLGPVGTLQVDDCLHPC